MDMSFLSIDKNWKKFALLFFGALLISVLRRPDVLTAANFWAEDGVIWYAQLYNDGLISMFRPQDGYFQTISRLAMLAASYFDILYAPIVSNFISLLIRTCPVLFLFSTRFSFVSTRNKAFLAAYYLLMPNLNEVFGNITNAQWFLALYLLQVILAEKPESFSWKVHDGIVLLLSGLSGPFIICLFPCLVLKLAAFYRKLGRVGCSFFDVMFVFLVGVQCLTVFITAEGRSSAPLGASFSCLAQLVTSKILLGSFFKNSETYVFVTEYTWAAIVLFVLFAGVLLFFLLKSGWRFRVASCFPLLMLAAAFAKPMVSLQELQWPRMLMSGSGARYFVIPNILFFAFILYVLHWFFHGKSWQCRRRIYGGLIVLMLAMAIPVFRISSLPNRNYAEEIKTIYYPAQSGSIVEIPINPPDWKMVLKKK